MRNQTRNLLFALAPIFLLISSNWLAAQETKNDKSATFESDQKNPCKDVYDHLGASAVAGATTYHDFKDAFRDRGSADKARDGVDHAFTAADNLGRAIRELPACVHQITTGQTGRCTVTRLRKNKPMPKD